MTTDRLLGHLGFRARVLGVVAVLLVAATAIGLLVQREVLLRRHDRAVTASLVQERTEIERLAAGSDPETGEPFAGDVEAIFDTFLRHNVPDEGEVFLTLVDGEPYATTRGPEGVRIDRDERLVRRWASLRTGELGGLQTDAGHVEYLAVPMVRQGRSAGVFVVANFVQREQEEIESGLRVEAIAAGLVLLVVIGAAWVLAGRLLRPVKELTEATRAISDTDLSRRITVDGDDEIAELARTVNDMLDRLESAFAAQRDFVDDAGHELRTPITIVRGHLELMGDEPQDRVETVALVTDELDRMARIVDDMLVLATADHPDFVRPDSVELSDFTTDLLMKARALGNRTWRLDAAATGAVECDPQRLAQAVLNLARNAVEHTEESTEIAIGSSRRDGEMRIWVRDNGPGIEAHEQEWIFDRFARGAGPRRSQGAGLGLAIARAVAIGHRGRIELDTAPGAGATFTLVLPAGAHAYRDELGAGARDHPSGDVGSTLASASVSSMDAPARTS
jgi:signal transduction histidine kinase